MFWKVVDFLKFWNFMKFLRLQESGKIYKILVEVAINVDSHKCFTVGKRVFLCVRTLFEKIQKMGVSIKWKKK